MQKCEYLLALGWVGFGAVLGIARAWVLFGNPAAMLRVRTHALQHALSPTNALYWCSPPSHRVSLHSHPLSRTQRLAHFSGRGPWTSPGLLQLFPSCKYSPTITAPRESCKNSDSGVLSAPQRVQAEHYLQLVVEQNKSLNLTGVRTQTEAPAESTACSLYRQYALV